MEIDFSEQDKNSSAINTYNTNQTIVGRLKTNGRANGCQVVAGKNGGLYYINTMEKMSHIPIAKRTMIDFN